MRRRLWGCFLPGLTGSFHFVGQMDVFRPNVELPLLRADQAAEDAARVHANAHIDHQFPLLPSKRTFFQNLKHISKIITERSG